MLRGSLDGRDVWGRMDARMCIAESLRSSPETIITSLTGPRIAGRNINNLRYADHTTLMAESEEELKSLLMKLKEEIEKVGVRINIQKTTIPVHQPQASCILHQT